MRKLVLVLGVMALLTLSMVMAAKIDYKARCDFIRPATEYRPEKVFQGIGVYAAKSDGSLTCIVPKRHRAIVKPVVVEDDDFKPVLPKCEEVETCTWVKDNCLWYIWSHGRKTCILWDYDKVCETKTVCEEIDTKTSETI